MDRPPIESLVSCVELAITRFNDSGDQETLLCPLKNKAEPKTSAWTAAHERAIAHRFAFYLECALREKKIVNDKGPISVDCEYNRHIEDDKKLSGLVHSLWIVVCARRTPLPVPDNPELFEFIVSPDVIVHKRRTDELNLLIVEVKKFSNSEFPEYDDFKLELFTSEKGIGYGYDLGIGLLVRDDLEPKKRCLEIRTVFSGGIPIWPE